MAEPRRKPELRVFEGGEPTQTPTPARRSWIVEAGIYAGLGIVFAVSFMTTSSVLLGVWFLVVRPIVLGPT